METNLQAVENFIWASKALEVSVETIEQQLDLARHEVVSSLQELAAAGHGTFVPGRRSRPSRIVKSASRPMSAPVPGLVGRAESHVETSKISQDTEPSNAVQVFVLKRDKPFRFVVPADLTKTEAEKVCKWLDLVSEG